MKYLLVNVLILPTTVCVYYFNLNIFVFLCLQFLLSWSVSYNNVVHLTSRLTPIIALLLANENKSHSTQKFVQN